MEKKAKSDIRSTNFLLVVLIGLFWCAHQREIRGTIFGWDYDTHQTSRDSDFARAERLAEERSAKGWRHTGVWCPNGTNAYMHMLSRPWGLGSK